MEYIDTNIVQVQIGGNAADQMLVGKLPTGHAPRKWSWYNWVAYPHQWDIDPDPIMDEATAQTRALLDAFMEEDDDESWQIRTRG